MTGLAALLSREDPEGRACFDAVTIIDTFHLVRVVRADLPEDDEIPDFLLNEVGDGAPDVLWTGAGEQDFVAQASNVVFGPVTKQAKLAYRLTASMPAEWGYLMVDNPLPDTYIVGRVFRDDGRVLPPENCWLTRRTIRLLGGGTEEESLLHLLDYGGPGAYLVNFQSTVEVDEPPVADAGADQNAYLGDVVTLDGTGSQDPNNDFMIYLWTFLEKPAGSAAEFDDKNAQTPSFTVDVRGDYVIQLQVSDGLLDSPPDTTAVHGLNRPPVAYAGADRTAAVGGSVALDGRGSQDDDGDTLTYAWSFSQRPGGSAATFENPASATPGFDVDAPGVYVAQLVVNDGIDDSAPDNVVITTDNQIPVAVAGPAQTVAVGALVTLDGGGSYDPDGSGELTFAWTLVSRPAGSAAVLSGAGTANPQFTVDVAGDYVAQLVVNDGEDNSLADTVTVSTQNSPPVANAGSDQTVAVGGLVTLDGSASYDVDGVSGGLRFSWSFLSRPAGSAAALTGAATARPTFIADADGEYLLRLVVNDGAVNSAPDTVTVSTSNTRPVARAGADQTARVGDVVTLDASGSSDADQDELTFSWAFLSRPAGSTAALTAPATVRPSFTVDVAGAYIVQLVVNDGALASLPDTVTVSTINSAPVANAGPDQHVQVGTVATLDGSGSSDPDSDELTFSWSLTSRPAGSAATLINPASVTPFFTLDRTGEYVIQLVVHDGKAGSVPDTVKVSTQNGAPVANAGADQSKQVGEAAFLNGSASRDPDNDPLTYAWSFASRPAGSAAMLAQANTVRPNFVVDAPGDYVVQLTVNDGELSSDPDTVRITTINSPPVSDAGPDQTRGLTETVVLDGSGSSDPDNDELSYQWSFTSRPEGSAAVLDGADTVSPQFVVDVAGTYIVQLVVHDGAESSAPDTMQVSTENSAPVADAGPDATAFVGDTVSLDGSGSYDVDGDPLEYLWHFVSRPPVSEAVLLDGGTVSPRFQVDASGEYVLRLVVNDGIRTGEADTVTVSTENSAPVARAGSDQTRFVGQTVSLDGRDSIDVDGDALAYTWSFTSRPAGSAAVLQNANEAVASFVIDAPGSYVVQLVVHDGTVSSAPDSVVVSTANSKPVASAGTDISALVGQTVRLDGRGSADADGDALTHRWSLSARPPGSNAFLVEDTTPRPLLTPDVLGHYVVQLIVNDGKADSTPDTVSVFATDVDAGCVSPPEAPESVSASDGLFEDRVEVIWSEVEGATEYRVYRSDTNDPITAAPVTGWLAALSFTDVSAAPETAGGCGGCAGAPEPGPAYFYWVRARSAENCASGLAGPDSGYAAGGGKAWFGFDSVFVEALPGGMLETGVRAAAPGATLYVRLRDASGEAIEPSSVWGEVRVGDACDHAIAWLPSACGDEADGWAAWAMPQSLTEGAEIVFSAGAETVAGRRVGPVEHRFVVRGETDVRTPVLQPDYADMDASSLDLTLESNALVRVSLAGDGGAPDEAVPVYEVEPGAAYPVPQRIWLPIPSGVPARDVAVFYFLDDAAGGRWLPADRLAGWLMPEHTLWLEWNGEKYLGLLVTHGGAVRTGLLHETLQSSSVAAETGSPWGDLLVSALAIAAAVLSARRVRARQAPCAAALMIAGMKKER